MEPSHGIESSRRPSVLPTARGGAGRIVRIEREQVECLVKTLAEKGYTVIGPTVRDSAVVFDRIYSASELPKGWTDEQTNASYRLEKNGNRWFGYSSTPGSWKRFLFAPRMQIFRSTRNPESVTIEERDHPRPRYAFLGIRPCDLEAIRIQDKVFLHGGYSDPAYAEIRKEIFLVAVTCADPGGTCFCSSMGTGPAASKGFDIQLTEIVIEGDAYFLAEAGSEQGNEVLAMIPQSPATEEEQTAATSQIGTAARSMGRRLETGGVKELLMSMITDQHWESIGKRCLACANCSLVCPTCFCSTVEDTLDLTGTVTERTRRWDSCFTGDFSYIHGGSVRSTIAARYRQWLLHKLAFWTDQFGTFGCVGCGRCITWCPAGIDLTEEALTLRIRGEKSRTPS